MVQHHRLGQGLRALRRRRLRAAAFAAFLLCLAAAAPAAASRTQESIFEDEHALLDRGPAAAALALDEIDALGADTVRSVVVWSRLAPRAPAGSDPRAYPPSAWDPYDDLVRGTRLRGLGLLLSPTTPGPRGASRCRPRRPACKPSPRAYRAFVTALGRRYSGAYRDENQGGGVLPRVRRWSLLNEPNQPAWLTPQYERRRGRRVAASPVLYRALARAGIAGLRASGHGRDQVLLGETSPIGRTWGSPARRPMPPAEFLRTLFCLGPRGKPLRGSAARRAACAGRFGRLAVAGFAHHPYPRGGSRPPASPPSARGEITISSPRRLTRILDAAARARRIPRRLPVHYTEFGFQTNPPDRIFGVRPARQAAYLNQSDWMAWRDPRVRSVAQYKLVDDVSPASFQSGLRFADGRAKPGYAAYRLPIWVTRRQIYGQLRPARNGTRQVVRIQVRRRGGAFRTVKTVTVRSRRGHFVTRLPRRAGTWRLAWGSLVSREARP